MPTQVSFQTIMQSPIFPLSLMLFIMYFLLIRPQKAQQKERLNMIKGLTKNDQVITAAGIHGTIVLVKDRTVMVRVDDNVKIEFDKDAIVKVIKN